MRLAALLLSALALIGCGRESAPTKVSEASPPSGEPPTIEVVRVVERPLDVTLDMPGELDPYEEVAIVPRVTGYVKTIRVDRGSRVHAGELLVQLEAPELLAQRAEAESKLQASDALLGAVRSKVDADTSTFDKLKAASATPGVVAGNDVLIAQKAMEADRSQVTSAERNVEAARQALNSVTQIEEYLKITAPFDGMVTERNVHAGALVGPAAGTMLRLVNRNRLRLIVPVPEAYVGGVSEGLTVPFTVAAYPGEVFTAKVSRIAHAIDTKTRTMAVELDVANGDGRLAPGGFSQVRWPVRRNGPSILVPTSSVASTTDRTFVVRIREGKTEWVDVKTGLTAGPLVEVFGDVHPGDEIAVRGTDELRAGTRVRIKQSTANS